MPAPEPPLNRGSTPPDFERLHRDVAFGRAGGQIIWQPRILAWISDRAFAGQPLPAPFTGLTPPEIYRALGCSNRIYEFNACFVSHEDPAVRISRSDLDATDYEVVWATPVGRQRAVYRRSPNAPWHRPIKWPVADEDELRVGAWREARRTWTWDQAAFDRIRAEWAGLGAPTVIIPRVTLQKLIIEEMGIEQTVRALRRQPAACEAYFDALRENETRLLDVIAASPIRLINFGDNIHAGFVPPRWFERYVLPVYQWRSTRLHEAGCFVSAHWDGDCRPLLPYARDTGLDGIEAITPVPQGDVTLEETKAALGDMFLLDGLPAIYFEPRYDEQVLIDCAHRCIDLFAPHLVLGISDEISSQGDLARVRTVGAIVAAYNARVSVGTRHPDHPV